MKRRQLQWRNQYLELGTGVFGLGFAFELSNLLDDDFKNTAWHVSWKLFLGPLLFHGLIQVSRLKPCKTEVKA